MTVLKKKKYLKVSHNPKLKVIIGYKIRALRVHRDMTMADLAARSGLSLSMVSKIENGKTSASLTTLHKLSKTFSVPISTFFSG